MTEPIPPMTSRQGPSEQLLKDAYIVLERAVQETAAGTQWPTASKIRLRMKELTYGGFNPDELGYKKFRDFLHAAEAAGHVSLHFDHPGDVVVAKAGVSAPEAQSTRVRIRRDLWQAALDWRSGVDYVFDLEAKKAVMLPSEQVLLEPERVRELRKRISDGDEALVRVPRVTIKMQLEWMNDHVGGLSPSPLRDLLLEALSSDKPAKHYAAILRDQPSAQNRWFNALSANVLAHLQAWKDSEPRLSDLGLEAPNSPVAIGDVAETRPVPPVPAQSADGSVGRVPRLFTARLSDRVVRDRAVPSAEERLRALLHRAIDQMPESELRAIRIPAGYMLGD